MFGLAIVVITHRPTLRYKVVAVGRLLRCLPTYAPSHGLLVGLTYKHNITIETRRALINIRSCSIFPVTMSSHAQSIHTPQDMIRNAEGVLAKIESLMINDDFLDELGIFRGDKLNVDGEPDRKSLFFKPLADNTRLRECIEEDLRTAGSAWRYWHNDPNRASRSGEVADSITDLIGLARGFKLIEEWEPLG